MEIRKVTHVILDLTSLEVAMLKDLLGDAAEMAPAHGIEWERFRMDLLFNLPAEP